MVTAEFPDKGHDNASTKRSHSSRYLDTQGSKRQYRATVSLRGLNNEVNG